MKKENLNLKIPNMKKSMKANSETWPSKFSADFNKALVEKAIQMMLIT